MSDTQLNQALDAAATLVAMMMFGTAFDCGTWQSACLHVAVAFVLFWAAVGASKDRKKAGKSQ